MNKEQLSNTYPFNTLSGESKKEFIDCVFTEVIPEVLKSVVCKKCETAKQKAKNLYNINL